MIATVTLNPSLDEWIRLSSLRVGALNRATQFIRYPGGKGINVSRVIRELEAPTIAFALAIACRIATGATSCFEGNTNTEALRYSSIKLFSSKWPKKFT